VAANRPLTTVYAVGEMQVAGKLSFSNRHYGNLQKSWMNNNNCDSGLEMSH
jgi:hypothetical protein